MAKRHGARKGHGPPGKPPGKPFRKGKGKNKSAHRRPPRPGAFSAPHGLEHADLPELMDLSAPQSSSRYLGHLTEEAAYTRKNRRNIFERQLRNSPVEFVKSADLYDPSRLLDLTKKNKKESETAPEKETALGNETSTESEAPAERAEDTLEVQVAAEKEEAEIPDVDSSASVPVRIVRDEPEVPTSLTESKIEPELGDNVIASEIGNALQEPEKKDIILEAEFNSPVVSDLKIEHTPEQISALKMKEEGFEKEKELKKGKDLEKEEMEKEEMEKEDFEEDSEKDEKDYEDYEEYRNYKESDRDNDPNYYIPTQRLQRDFSEDDSLSLDSVEEPVASDQLFFIDSAGDTTPSVPPKKDVRTILTEKKKKDIQKVQSNILTSSAVDGSYVKAAIKNSIDVQADLEDEHTLTVGKLSMQTYRSSSGLDLYVDLPSSKKARTGFKDFHTGPLREQQDLELAKELSYREYMEDVLLDNSDQEFDYGSDEPDSDLDFSENEGELNQLREALRSEIDQSGSEDDDPEQADFEPFVDDYPYSSDSSQRPYNYLDDLSGSDFEMSEDDDDDMLGQDVTIDEFLSFGQNVQKFAQLDILDRPTQSIKYRGKGKNKKPILDHIDDLSLRDDLLSQYENRRLTKTDKRKLKKEKRREQALSSNHNLLELYPYSMHIKEIKLELESLRKDTDRQSAAFPPMDPHGVKTVIKMAGFYNFKGRRLGQGKQMHAVVVKNKRTYGAAPQHDMVNRMLKQRPIFNRIDVKKPIAVTTQVKGERNSRTETIRLNGGSASKAHVKEGDIVGVDAPEIGQDNIGRRMLEKLGWSAGQGLGADHNKGLQEPLFAKVKKSKLGIK